jgi:hypothetical protein
MRDSEERVYSSDWLQVGRPQPMYCDEIDSFIKGFYLTDNIIGLDVEFKEKFIKWLKGHTLNTFRGIDAFSRLDVSYGCTQYIDDLYQRLGNNLKTLKGDYTYHKRLNPDIQFYEPKDAFDYSMQAQRPELLIAMPFPSMGDIHPQMQTINNSSTAIMVTATNHFLAVDMENILISSNQRQMTESSMQ